jgi:hypothetical protein
MRNPHKKIILACLVAGSFFFSNFPSLFAPSALFAQTALRAQTALPASLEHSGVLSPERRTELQAELRRHAAVIEAQSAVLKTVSKLVGPTVVFIEAEREVFHHRFS